MHDALAEAFAASPAGWGLVTPDGRLADANPALCRMLGYDRAEVVGLELWDLVADRDDERDARERRVLATGSVEGFRQDRRLLRGDGPEAIGHVVGALVRDAGGRPRYWSCVVEDVTHARRAVDLLAENEERLAEAQHLARLGSWEIDVAADRLRWSAGLLKILGLDAAEAPASFTAALDFVHPVDRERCVSVVRAAIDDAPWLGDRLPAGAPGRPRHPRPCPWRGGDGARRAAWRWSAAPARTSRNAAASRTRCATPSSSSAGPSTTRRSGWRCLTWIAAGCGRTRRCAGCSAAPRTSCAARRSTASPSKPTAASTSRASASCCPARAGRSPPRSASSTPTARSSTSSSTCPCCSGVTGRCRSSASSSTSPTAGAWRRSGGRATCACRRSSTTRRR